VPELPDTLTHVVREPAGDRPTGALVLLHGRGADEHDLQPFLELLDPGRRLLGVTLGGPLALPPGGRHWYVVPRVGFPDPATFASSYALLGDWLAELSAATGLPPERIVLGGFSQGAVMALALALGAGRPTPAAVLALSGFVPAVDGWTADVERPGLAAFVTHGRRDPVIPVEFGRATRDLLEPSPVDVTYVETDAAHHVDPRTLAELPAWLERKVVLAAPQD
jgi:phospholipase/carboxylesterase